MINTFRELYTSTTGNKLSWSDGEIHQFLVTNGVTSIPDVYKKAPDLMMSMESQPETVPYYQKAIENALGHDDDYLRNKFPVGALIIGRGRIPVSYATLKNHLQEFYVSDIAFWPTNKINENLLQELLSWVRLKVHNGDWVSPNNWYHTLIATLEQRVVLREPPLAANVSAALVEVIGEIEGDEEKVFDKLNQEVPENLDALVELLDPRKATTERALQNMSAYIAAYGENPDVPLAYFDQIVVNSGMGVQGARRWFHPEEFNGFNFDKLREACSRIKCGVHPTLYDTIARWLSAQGYTFDTVLSSEDYSNLASIVYNVYAGVK